MANLKFSVTHNTPSDWAKAITTILGALVAAIAAAGLSAPAWLVTAVSVVVAFATALGFYSQQDVTEAPEDLEPSTQEDVPTEADVRIDGSVVETEGETQ